MMAEMKIDYSKVTTWNDATVYGDLDPALLDRFVSYAKGKGRKEQNWQDHRVLLRQLLDLLTKWERGPKDGDAITQGKLAGRERGSNAVRFNDVIIIDSDTGQTMEEGLATVKDDGFFAVAWHTHSHGKDVSTVPERTFLKFLQTEGEEPSTDAAVTTRQLVHYFTKVKKYVPRVCGENGEDASFDGKDIVGTDGMCYFLKHNPQDRFKILLLRETSFSFTEGTTQRHRIDQWKAEYRALCEKLGVAYDATCADPARLQYTPRVGFDVDVQRTGHKIIILAGRCVTEEDIESAVTAQTWDGKRGSGDDDVGAAFRTASGGKGNGSTYQPTTPGLIAFVGKYRDLDVVRLCDDVLGDRVRNSDDDDGANYECPNSDAHTKETDGFFAKFDPDESSWFLGCNHATCQDQWKGDNGKQDRARPLDLICQQHGLTVADLRQYSETARVEDAKAQEEAKEATDAHAKVWGDAEALGRDQEALDATVKAFNEKPTNEVLRLILMALATLPEIDVSIGATLKKIRKASGHDLKVLRGFYDELVKRYEASKGAATPPDPQADHAEEDLSVGADEFTVDPETGRPYPNQRNIKVALRKLGVGLSFNEFSGVGFVTRNNKVLEIDDTTVVGLWLEIDRKFKFRPSKEFFYDVLGDVAFRNKFHPVREYLAKVQKGWDGISRVDTWLIDYCGAEDTPFNRAAGRLWMMAAVRRIRQPGCKFDEMPVLESLQGLGKSTLFQVLAGGPEFFTDSVPMNAEPKLIIELTRGKWIVECSDMQGHKKAETEAVKAMLSRQVDRSRMAFGRLTANVPRQFVLAGTVNFPEDGAKYLNDRTGNRRFWPVEVTRVDLERVKADRDQLWGEAAVLEAADRSEQAIRLNPSLWGEAAKVQNSRLATNRFVDKLDSILGDYEGRIRVSDVVTLLNLQAHQLTQHVQAEITDAMKELGWTKKSTRIGGRSVKGYIKGDSPVVYRPIWIDSTRSWGVTDGSDVDLGGDRVNVAARQIAAVGRGSSFDGQDPSQWHTGGNPMTVDQANYLRQLCAQTGETFNPNLTKAEAARRIDALKT